MGIVANINGNGSPSYTANYAWNEVNGTLYLPTARTAHNGTTPLWITGVSMYLTGNGAARDVQMRIGGAYTGGFTVGRGYSGNASTGMVGIDAKFGNSGGSTGIGHDPVGSAPVWFGLAPGGDTVVAPSDGPYYFYSRSYAGQYEYIQVPAAPTTPTADLITSSSFRLSWAASGDAGGGSITGYRIQVSTTNNFSSDVQSFDATGSPYTVSGLLAGTTYYARVLTKNQIYSNFGGNPGSPWSGTRTITTIINPPVWSDTTLASTFRVNSAYSDAVAATGGTVSYSVSDGSLPAGIDLNTSTGAITGTPTTVNTYTFTLRATNAGGFISQSYTRSVVPETSKWIDNVIETEMRVGTVYSDSISADGTGIEYTVESGTLPDGITLDTNTGAISGTPTTPGTYDITIIATNDSGGQVAQDFSIIVKPSGQRYYSESASSYVTNIKKWNGFEWVSITNIKRFDGTDWVNLEG
jgi:hypothetical protein